MAFERLQRAYGNWRRKRSRIGPGHLPEPFCHAADMQTIRDRFAALDPDQEGPSDAVRTVRGECFVCAESVNFAVAPPGPDGRINWRETLTCPGCGLINRWRSCIHLFEAVCEPTGRDRIYLTERLSPVYRTLAKRYPRLIGSEYVPHARPGELVELHAEQVRNEDVTRLSFGDRTLDAVLCFDVLEHVPDYRRALREFHRVLVSGGQLVLSVPFSYQQQTVVRAVVGDRGAVQHLLPPCFHGDPLAAGGVLSYYDFGFDLVDELTRAGFTESFLVCYRSARWAYPQENIAYIARKLRG